MWEGYTQEGLEALCFVFFSKNTLEKEGTDGCWIKFAIELLKEGNGFSLFQYAIITAGF